MIEHVHRSRFSGMIGLVNRSRFSAMIGHVHRSRFSVMIGLVCRSRFSGVMRARRNRAFRIRSPCRRYRAHTAASPNPSAMIPVPILITGNPNAFPPAIAIFRDHRRLNNYRCWRRRRLNYYSRGRGYNISLLWREKYVIKVAEKSVYSTGIFPVINMSPRDMSVITGT